VGNAQADDAAVYRIGPGQVLVQTVDFFTPVVDDPYVFGQIAAANALSDVYAMRARPVLALALAAFPTGALPPEMLEEILRGGAEKVAEAGAVIGGGHSIDHDIPLYGLAVTGFAPEAQITRNMGALPGDALVLTKPLGIGVTVSAGRVDSLAAEGMGRIFHRDLLDETARAEVIAVMGYLNRAAAEAMEGFEIHAATDVTGYGLLGHAYEMMDASGTTGEFSVTRVPLLSQARRLASRGIAPDGSRVNVRHLRPRADVATEVSDDDFLLLCDAQTSGGLLVSLPEREAESYASRCRERGAPAGVVIGRVLPKGEKTLRVVA
jgi:selenide, water dikinase